MKVSVEDAQQSYKISKVSQSANSSMKYQVPNYQVGGIVWLNRSLFKDAYAKSKESDKLSARRFGPFLIEKLFRKNALKLELPDHIKIHPVLHVRNTVTHKEKPAEIAVSVQSRPEPIQADEGEDYEVEDILPHRKSGRGFQFLTAMKGEPTHDDKWVE